MLNVQTPAARASDPLTSHAAADEHTASGKRAAQQAQTAAAVAAHPGLTSNELSRHCALDRYALARRLPECETGTAVVRGQARRCAVSGKMAVTWWPPGSAEQRVLFPKDPA